MASLLGRYVHAIVLVVGTCATTSGQPVRFEVTVTKMEYLVAEPVSLTLSWTNRSETPIEFDLGNVYNVSTIQVSIDGGQFVTFTRPGGIIRRRVSANGLPDPVMHLAPGESFGQTAFLIEGLYEGSQERFLLYRPGRYTLRAGPHDRTSIELRVDLPTSIEDKQAFVPWKEASPQFALVPFSSTASTDRLKALIAKHPKSLYTEYARLGIARQLVLGHLRDKSESRKEAATYLASLRDSNNLSIVEHALWVEVFLADSHDGAKRIAYKLQQVNPKSEYLQRLRKMGIMPKEPGREDEAEQPRLSPEEKPTTRGPIPLLVDQGSLAGLPAGAAKLLEKYWKAFARRDIDGAMECLSDDFVSIDGTRDRRRRYWESTLATVDVTHLHIRVDKTYEATSYRSPPGPVGKSTRLQGDLLVVQGQGTAREKGRTDASAITWVLRRVNEDTWTIVSEFAGPVGQQQGEAGESPEAVDPADQPRPPAQQPPEKPDGAEAAQEGWIVVHPAQAKFDPEHFKTVPMEDRSFVHEKHRRDEILRELIGKYGAEKDIEIREGGGQIFVVYRWVKDPWLEQMREEYARATLDQFKLIYARDEKVGPYVLKDMKTQYDVTVDHVPYALMLQFHDDQRLATAQVTIGGQKDLVDPTTVAPPDQDEWRPTRMGDSLVYWRRTADGTQLSWYNKWGHKLMVSGITRADDPLLKHFLERFPPPARREPPQ